MSATSLQHDIPATTDLPRVDDGAALWRLAKDTGVLDVNSSYAYLLWCRDFATTSVVARDATGSVLGFVTGYVRPDVPDTLMVWQVAVAARARGRGIAGQMLDALIDRRLGHGQTYLETTITRDNDASVALFSAAARRRDTELHRTELFTSGQFPDGHDDEVLFRIGPFRATATADGGDAVPSTAEGT